MNLTEKNYITRISNQLERYKVINNNPYTVNFRCPICGDSQKRKHIARAYIFEKGNQLRFNCFNCDSHFPFWVFLKDHFSNIYLQYKVDWMRNTYGEKAHTPQEETCFKTTTHFDSPKFNLGTVLNQVDQDNPVLEYVIKRKIPNKYWNSLFCCDDINTITQQIEKYKHIKFTPEPILVIPLFNENREFSYINIRSISDHSFFRYLLLQVSEQFPKIWGLENVDYEKPIFVTEGPIDAMCCSNSIAMIGTSKHQAIQYLKPQDKNLIFVFDNELSSNRDIRRAIEKTISSGYSVVLFDKKFPYKDINKAVVEGGWSIEEIDQYLTMRTFSSLRAKLELGNILKNP